jgi:hypothetical protein
MDVGSQRNHVGAEGTDLPSHVENAGDLCDLFWSLKIKYHVEREYFIYNDDI